MFVLACVIGVLGLRLVQSFVSPWIPPGARETSFMLVMAGGLVIGHAWTFQLVEPRGWSFVGLGRDALAAKPIGSAALLGALAILLPTAALLLIGWLRVAPGDATSPLGTTFAAFAMLAPAALWEELFVRGYAFSLLRERWGAVAAILATSLVFGGTHLLNADVSWQAIVVVTLGGIFLGLIRESFQSLYAAWAAHLAWNVALAIVLHANVSGLAMEAPRYRVVDAGPDWATGGPWGPEGGFFAAGSLALAIWYIYRRLPARRQPDA